jgi:myxalamid-type nonribosomal peptide synthetase MxaA
MDVAGELWIAGVGLARGYLGRADLTAEKFVPSPFSGGPGARAYRTGDLARFLPTGEVQYLGRIDHQVKVRGFRIELGEIEAALEQHPAVRECVVTVAGETAERHLVAYFVSATGEVLSPDELQAFLRQRLPEYEVPALYVRLEAMPLSPNGKVDRAGLPAPEPVRPTLGTVFQAPSTADEVLLASIWAEVLKIEDIGLHDNFFNLGGNSILGLRAVALARERGLPIGLQDLFVNRTIADLARSIVGSGSGVAAPEDEELAEILTEVDGLSEDEVQALLQEEL